MNSPIHVTGFRALLPINAQRVPKGSYMRLRVEVDPKWDTVEIAEEYTTSDSPLAKTVLSLNNNTIELLDDELEWLHARLGEVIDLRKAGK